LTLMSSQQPQSLSDLDLPSLDELFSGQFILRFFDEYDHVMDEDCPCRPQIVPSEKSRSGLIIVHNRYNYVPLCSLND